MYSPVVIYFFNENSGNVIFSSDEIGILSVDLNNINFDDYNFDEDERETTAGDRLMAQRNRFKQRKAFKKVKILMPVAWHLTRW